TRAASAPDTPVPPQVADALPSPGGLGLLLSVVIACAFTALGAVIVARDPGHAIGWIFCAIGVASSLGHFTDAYAIYALVVAPDRFAGWRVAGWVQHWIWIAGIMLLVAFMPLRFPTGHLLSARWRPAWWLAVGATTAAVLVEAFAPGPLGNVLVGADVPNPVGVASLAGAIPALAFVLLPALLASILLAVASLVVRLHRARGVERQQIKWFAYFATLFALVFVAQGVVSSLLGITSPALDVAWELGIDVPFTGLPVATGLAILRYRLFDIDVLIRRTLVYGSLTALLAGMYFGLVLGAQAAVQALTGQTGQQPLLLVATTLLMAA